MTPVQRSAQGVTLIELLIAVAIIAVIVSVTAPGLTTGLATVRLSSAAGDAASFLMRTMNTVERREEPAAVVIAPSESEIRVFTAASGEKPANELKMPQGITIEGDEPTRLVLYPGGVFPRIALKLRNEKGSSKSVDIDPITGVPVIR